MMDKAIKLSLLEREAVKKTIYILYDAAILLGWKPTESYGLMPNGYAAAIDLLEDLYKDA